MTLRYNGLDRFAKSPKDSPSFHLRTAHVAPNCDPMILVANQSRTSTLKGKISGKRNDTTAMTTTTRRFVAVSRAFGATAPAAAFLSFRLTDVDGESGFPVAFHIAKRFSLTSEFSLFPRIFLPAFPRQYRRVRAAVSSGDILFTLWSPSYLRSISTDVESVLRICALLIFNQSPLLI